MALHPDDARTELDRAEECTRGDRDKIREAAREHTNYPQAVREMTLDEWIVARLDTLAREMRAWRELKAHLPSAYLQRGVSDTVAALNAVSRHG